MRVQLWSSNFAPEAIGIAPVSTAWARTMTDLGHDVSVVAAHPHYPSPEWGPRRRPYREAIEGVPVIRLPLWIGRHSSAERVRQEVSFAVSQAVAAPFLGSPDVLVSVSPSFPALGVGAAAAAIRRIPWIAWIQDVLPDGAVNTGLLRDGLAVRVTRRYERRMYAAADAIVVIADSHRRNLLAKGVPDAKLTVISNPVTLQPPANHRYSMSNISARVVLNIGNIGLSQGLVPLARAFESAPEIGAAGVQLRFAGDGVAAGELRESIRTSAVKVLGIIPESIDGELRGASLGLVSQLPAAGEFNMPSRLMTFFAYGLPVIAVVDPDSEVARVVRGSGGGWIVDAARPADFAAALMAALGDPGEMLRRSDCARAYAGEHFTQLGTAREFERVMVEAVRARGGERL